MLVNAARAAAGRTMTVGGGMGTVWGPLLGATMLLLADESMPEFGDWHDIGLGLLLAPFVILLPKDLAGLKMPSRTKPVS